MMRVMQFSVVVLVTFVCLVDGHRATAAEAHGLRESWVFNRAMVWLDEKTGVRDAVICYSSQSPLPLTGREQVSQWYVGQPDELADVDDEFSRFVKKDPKAREANASLPPLQFHVEQQPIAELKVTEATHPWRFSVSIKGRGGPPLYESPWQEKPGTLRVDLLQLYREKGYAHHFPELQFFVATRTEDPKQQASVKFRLRLNGRAAIIPSLPIIRTSQRAKREGVPICAVVLDESAKRLGKDVVEVAASVGGVSVKLQEAGNGIWQAVVKELPIGDHEATLRAVWKDGAKTAVSNLDVHVTDGQFVDYDPKLRMLTKNEKPIGPVSGSWHGGALFKDFGTPQESLAQGQEEWQAAHAKGNVGSHAWESLTEPEIEADYAYLARCGWSAVHLCGGWSMRERLDAGGRIAPHGAEQLASLCKAARRHKLPMLFALSHYMLGYYTPPYAQYLEAGYQPGGIKGEFTGYTYYNDPDSVFYRMFTSYLADFATIFRDETGIFALSAAGEGDIRCGKTFVNTVYDFMRIHDGNHLFICEPHHSLVKRPDYYQRDGWKPVLGGMRTYHIDRHGPAAVGVQFKLSAMSDVFLAEGLAWGWGTFKDAASNPDHYRRENRRTFYTGLAYRNPIVITWAQCVVEDEHVVFGQVRQAVDWSKPFARPPLALRIDLESMSTSGRPRLYQYESALSRIPLEYAYVWEDEPLPQAALFTIDARQPFAEPAFVAEGGKLPDSLRTEMPLGLPAGFEANYSWSQDRRTLLAFIRRTNAESAGDESSPAKGAADIVLKNFPPGRQSFRLFDLAAKNILLEGHFEGTLSMKAPQQQCDLFLLVEREGMVRLDREAP